MALSRIFSTLRHRIIVSCFKHIIDIMVGEVLVILEFQRQLVKDPRLSGLRAGLQSLFSEKRFCDTVYRQKVKKPS